MFEELDLKIAAHDPSAPRVMVLTEKHCSAANGFTCGNNHTCLC